MLLLLLLLSGEAKGWRHPPSASSQLTISLNRMLMNISGLMLMLTWVVVVVYQLMKNMPYVCVYYGGFPIGTIEQAYKRIIVVVAGVGAS